MNLFPVLPTFLLLFYVLDGEALEIKLKSVQRRAVVAKVSSNEYLYKYGYFPGYCDAATCKLEKEQQKRMITDFQSFANLQETGIIDAATVRQMEVPRCSNKDKKFPGFTGRNKRYNPQGSTWAKVKRGESLTWRYAKPNTDPNDPDNGMTEDLSKKEVRRILTEAMKKWTDVANVKFQEIGDTDGTPDIWIYFGRSDHGDIFPFDGRGGTLAHAFYPLNNKVMAGDMHFDDAEMFTDKTTRGRNLMWVATHELGHSLGLAHSNVRDAVMYPYYTGYRPDFKLRDDDIRGIQSLYGKAVTKRPKPARKEICPIDVTAAWLSPKHDMRPILVTTSDEAYTVDKKGDVKRALLPSGILKVDAAFTARIFPWSEDPFTVLFSGETYSVYTKDFQLHSSGHSIHELRNNNGKKNPLQLNFPYSVKNIHAAVKWQRNGKLYFFYKYNGVGYYRRYNLKRHAFYRSSYTKKMDWRTDRRWKGLPTEGPDAAISSSSVGTYFVVGNEIYKYNDRRIRKYDGYPKQLGKGGLLRCESQEFP